MRLFSACAVAMSSLVAVPQRVLAQTVEEVVVTAQKREERLQDVPVAVTALTAKALDAQGIRNTRDLGMATLGLVVTQSSVITRPQIRGVGARGSNISDESSVPTYVDGVYQAAQTNALFEFNNIERIEVLKGPQGILFGRNAQGGAINIITRDPSPDFDLRASASYGRFNERVDDLFLNGPLLAGAAANVAVHASADDGYIKDIGPLIGGSRLARRDTLAARAKVLIPLSSAPDLTVVGDYSDSNDNTGQSLHPVDGNSRGYLTSAGGNSRNAQGINVLQNATSAEIYGGETETTWSVTDRWDTNAGLPLVHARFGKFPGAINFIPNPATGGAGNLQVITGVSGNRVPKVPPWSVNLSTTYEQPIQDGKITLAGSLYIAGNYWWDTANLIGTDQVTMLNARATWTPPGDHWSLTLRGQNLTNADIQFQVSQSATGTSVGLVRPRSVGVKISYRYR